MKIRSISHKAGEYPPALREISSPPKQIFALGILDSRTCVAIVGSRKATDYGRLVTYQLAYELARANVSIVSGLALGIDTIAHQAAIDAGGHTIAVLAGGLDGIYPPSNRGLAKQILANGGALISEYPTGTIPFKQNFPARNRIIAGLSQATLVTEAAAKSGALITANFALQQNRLVMAVPGNINSPASAGPNNLIRSGALPITSASDVLSELNIPQAEKIIPKADSKEEETIIKLMKSGISSSQELIDQAGISAQQFAQIISLMEITGKVKSLGAGHWML